MQQGPCKSQIEALYSTRMDKKVFFAVVEFIILGCGSLIVHPETVSTFE